MCAVKNHVIENRESSIESLSVIAGSITFRAGFGDRFGTYLAYSLDMGRTGACRRIMLSRLRGVVPVLKSPVVLLVPSESPRMASSNGLNGVSSNEGEAAAASASAARFLW